MISRRLPQALLSLLVLGIVFTAPATLRANARANAVSFGGSKHRSAPMTAQEQLLYKIESKIVWHPDTAQPITRMEISLSENTLRGFQGDKEVVSTLVSTGREGYETKPGNYSVIAKDPEHHSNLYGSFCKANGAIVNNMAESDQSIPSGLHYQAAPMPWYLRLTDAGLGLHAGFVTGYPVSHGCIRLPPTFAQDLFPLVPVGTPVKIVP
jgi:lipoprotein-anchoring transpeptidase ErfK/SrfK